MKPFWKHFNKGNVNSFPVWSGKKLMSGFNSLGDDFQQRQQTDIYITDFENA